MARLARVDWKTTEPDKLTQQNISQPTTGQTLKWIGNGNRNPHQKLNLNQNRTAHYMDC